MSEKCGFTAQRTPYTFSFKISPGEDRIQFVIGGIGLHIEINPMPGFVNFPRLDIGFQRVLQCRKVQIASLKVLSGIGKRGHLR